VFNWRDLKLRTKIGVLSVGGLLLMALALWSLAAWQSLLFSQRAEQEAARLLENDLRDITRGVYSLVVAQDEALQQQVNYNLNVARYVLNNTGAVALSSAEEVAWDAVNQFTLQSALIRLPQMYVGAQGLERNEALDVPSPVVDFTSVLVGGRTTIFQRMNAQGDMLRVATNVETLDGRRAIGTFIPAVNPDGTFNPVINTVLRGEVYQGSAYVVNAWYLTAYEPLYDAAGEVIGMLFVGVPRENVASLRQAILDAQVGEFGYVFIMGTQGDQRGMYFISKDGQLDGVSMWDRRNDEGRYVAREIAALAQSLERGEQASIRYLWQNPDEREPSWRITRLTYYEPWDWVIGATAYESDVLAYEVALQEGRETMLLTLGSVSVIMLLIVVLLSFLLARSIVRPLGRLVKAAANIAAGDLDVVVETAYTDEIGELARAFAKMTARLRQFLGSLEDQVSARTAELTQRTNYLTASTEVGRAVTQILDTELLIDQVVDLICERFDLYYVGLFLVDEDREWAFLRAGTGEAGQQMLARQHRIRVGEGMIGWSIANALPRVALDADVDAVRLATSELPYTRSEAALPLRSRDQVLGALSVQSDKPGAFDQSAMGVLQVMADQVAAALDNAQLFARAQVAFESERRAYGDLTQQAWLKALRTRTDRGYRCDQAGVYALTSSPPLPAGHLTGPVHEDPFTVALPIQAREQTVGLVRLRKPEGADAWNSEELGLMTAVLDQLSVALESARLYQETQNRAQQERMVGEVTARIRETLDMETMLRTAAEQMRQVLDLDDIIVRLATPDGVE